MKSLFELQRLYNQKVYNLKNTDLIPEDLERITQELALCAHSEISDLIKATRFKKHHAGPTLADRTKILYVSLVLT